MGPDTDKSKIQAVVFDLDDTLYPERDYAFSGFDAVALAMQDLLGDPAETAAAMRKLFDTRNRHRVFDALLAQRGIEDNPKQIAHMVDVYRTHRPSITLHPDAKRALERFKGYVKLGLITDGPAIVQWGKIDALQLRSQFDRVIVTADLGPDQSKPAPTAFIQIAELLDVEPSRCAYVADNPAKDFIAPNQLGWLTVMVVRPDGIYASVPPAPGGSPQHQIDTLNELDTVLKTQ